MKSVKRGRGPSFKDGAASIGIALFGLLWSIIVFQSGGGLFGAFGLIFVAIGIINAIHNFRNAVSPDRYSEYYITDNLEETDPLNEIFGRSSATDNKSAYGSYSVGNSFCPYCGNEVKKNFEFCNNCGKKLP